MVNHLKWLVIIFLLTRLGARLNGMFTRLNTGRERKKNHTHSELINQT